MRKLLAGAAALAVSLLSAGLLAVPAQAAPVAAPQADPLPQCSGLQYSSTANLSQKACIRFSSVVGLYGDTDVVLPSNFATSHVTSCTLTASLVSTYGTVNSPTNTTDAYPNCLTAIRSSGTRFNSLNLTFGMGRGRAGDGYSLHVCITYATGAGTKSNCAQGDHPSTPNIYPPAR